MGDASMGDGLGYAKDVLAEIHLNDHPIVTEVATSVASAHALVAIAELLGRIAGSLEVLERADRNGT